MPRTSVASLTDAVYAISATLPATYDAAGYGSTTITYTTIGKVENASAHGSSRTINEFKPITGAVEKSKGAPDYGNMDLTFGDVPGDAGQIIVKAAEASANHYSVKVTYSDTEVHYLDVLVAGFEYSGGGEGAFRTITAPMVVNLAPVVVLPA